MNLKKQKLLINVTRGSSNLQAHLTLKAVLWKTKSVTSRKMSGTREQDKYSQK